ncbi:nucleoside-diphosphate kinase [Streptomyces similanensis]|uniref:Nucleoside diphosphate kinase-like domain-containing protein n=1 Tax=Streptomyces similanensis TaxID=1274988 RepID=A0ABP9JWC5_9ACTN
MRRLHPDSPPVAQLSEVTSDVLDAVTWSERKADLYAVDHYFREAVGTFGDIVPKMLGIALCMLKPEATAGRRLRPALRILREAGFTPVDVVPFTHDRLTIREVWRYQFNIASRQRIDAMDVILPSTRTVALVLKDERWHPGATPAAVRLNGLKGPADPALRRPEHLRHQLGVVNGLFNFTHISDEPADVLRELAVICDEPRRDLVRRRVMEDHDARSEALEVFQELEDRYPEHDFDLENSWRRLADAPGRLGRACASRPGLEEMLALTRETPLDGPHRWDLLTVVTHLLTEMNVDGVTPAVPNVTAAWDPRHLAGAVS